MVEEAIRKSEVLIEAIGYIRQFRNRISVVKLGGSVMENAVALDELLQDVVFMETVGMRPVIVHGGGKAITRAMADAGLEARFVKGRRYTDPETMQIVADVLIDEINADIVKRLEQFGGWAMGLHYYSCNCLFGEKMLLEENGEQIDLGRVGKVTRLDDVRLHKLAHAGIIPVLPSLALDADGELLNVNADTAAAAVAQILKAEKLVFLSDTPGILRDRKDENSLIASLTIAECQQLMADGVIEAGMIPKVEACIESLRAGANKVHLIDGRVRHSLLLEIYTNQGVGTEITAK